MTITMSEDKIQLVANYLYAEMKRASSITSDECELMARQIQAFLQDTEADADATTVDPFWHLAVDHTTAR